MKFFTQFILLAFTILTSCVTKTDNESNNLGTSGDSLLSKKSKIINYLPSDKTIVSIDTTITERQLKISITKIHLDSYVTNEWHEEGIKHLDRYRDAEISLKIFHDSQTLLDTTFRKQQFLKYVDSGFLDIAMFHNYWFKKIENNKIEFIGVITKPETDWTFGFNHYFDLTNKTLKFVKQVNEDEI